MAVTCIECEYDLTGTQPRGRCPECGRPAQMSYDAAEKQRPPLRADALAAIALCSAGALSTSIFTITVAVDHSLGLFGVLLTLLHVSPFAGMMAIIYALGRRGSSAAAFLWTSLILLGFAWACYFYILESLSAYTYTVHLMTVVPLAGWCGVLMTRFVVKGFI